MVRTRRAKRRRRNSINWFLIFLVLLFTFTFKPTIFDTETTIFFNNLFARTAPSYSPTPGPVNLDEEFSKIEDLLERGELLMAKDRLDRLLSRGIAGGKIHLLLGILYRRMAKEYYEKALSEFRMSSLYKGTEAESFYELGKLYFEEGDYKNAVEVLSKIKDIYKDDPILWKYLGISYIEIGDIKRGEEILVRAQKLAPKDKDIQEYLERLEALIPPTPTPTVTSKEVVVVKSTPWNFTKENIDRYFQEAKSYKEDVYIPYENVKYEISPDGGYKLSIFSILVIKNPKILNKGIRFSYDKRYVSFSLYLLEGIDSTGKKIGEDDFDYFIESDRKNIDPSYEDAVISYNASGPILLKYKIEVKQKAIVEKKFQIIVPPLIYPEGIRKVTFVIPQGISFNLYPREEVKVEDEKGYKKLYFDNIFDRPIVLSNFTTWKDLYSYASSLLKGISMRVEEIKGEPSDIYNSFLFKYWEVFQSDLFYFPFRGFAYSVGDRRGNIFATLSLCSLYRKRGISCEVALLKDSCNMGFPVIDEKARGVLFLKDQDTYAEPFPFLPFKTLLPNDEGKDAILLDTENLLRTPFSTWKENVREDYIKFSLLQPLKGEMISYAKGLCDFYYRHILWQGDKISDSKLWAFKDGIRIYQIEPSEMKRLDIPFQIYSNISLKKTVGENKFLPPYINCINIWKFPFTVKRRIEVKLNNHRINELPEEFLLKNKGALYKIDFSLSQDKKKLIVENIYILKDLKYLFNEEDLKKVNKIYVSFK